MKKAPDNHFGFGVLAFDPTHIIAAGGFIVYIGHGDGVKVQAKGPWKISVEPFRGSRDHGGTQTPGYHPGLL